MKYELIGKQKATLVDVDIQSLKVGQTDVRPAVALTFKVSRSNYCLSDLGKTFLGFFYAKGQPSAQQQIDGVAPVSEYGSLTPDGEMIGGFECPDEQTGSTLLLYHGIGDGPAMRLGDGTVSKLKSACREGGTVEQTFRFYTAEVDADTLGALGVLKSHELDIELTAPDIVSKKKKQKDLVDDAGDQQSDDADPAGGVTDEEAAAANALRNPPNETVVTTRRRRTAQTPEEALAQSVGSDPAAVH